ncbi:probable multidrug resistance-associated protein lethal(2)03659 isoform X2 [Phymastichus coffea]|uniref:probable multidrug resistance-associated protein lethal(2)03659 isoform X2 n=1 Tax=Phymastichus coffea TaxID=108790 RepID=UPI00273B4D91|nr:probable multidrug resistance-associated protein lethal(2)03659 isoform X2 [Phymastichus coffea]
MESSRVHSAPNRREKAKPLSVLFCWWTWGTLKKGYKKTYTVDDLGDSLKNDETSLLGSRLEKFWNVELLKAKPSLLRALFFTFWKGYSKALILGLLEIVIWVSMPLIFDLFLHAFSPESTATLGETLFYGLSLVGLDLIKYFIQCHMLFSGFWVGAQIHITICSLIYRKATRLNKTSLNRTSSGQIVNLIAHEVQRFHYLIINNVSAVSTSLCILLVASILYSMYGFAGIVGLILVIKISFIQVFTGSISVNYRQKATEKANERIRLIDEIISGVQVMKMYTWEKLFSSQVKKVKHAEFLLTKKASYFRNVFWTFNLFVPRIGIYSTLIAILLLGEIPTTQSIFVILKFLFLLNEKLLASYKGIGDFKDSLVAAHKIEEYLLLEEVSRSSNGNLDKNMIYEYVNKAFKSFEGDAMKEKAIEDSTHNELSVTIDNLSIAWDREPPRNVLTNVNLKFEKGKLYLVIGIVGSGKSSLLSSILKEINITRGSIHMHGRLSYAGQDTWIFGDTIRQNILFGEPYDHLRYDHVIKACCLKEDFKQFPKGDRSIVGEKGILLSGGQKARINLARAIYRQADVYLLDDPLSAVDAHVSKRLFEECIQNFLRNKTRILASHQLQYIKDVDAIVLVDNGTTYFYENYNELFNEHSEYRNLIAIEETKISTNTVNIRSLTMNEENSMLSYQSIRSDETRKMNDIIEKIPKNNEIGSLLMKYFKAGSNMFFILVTFLLFFLTQAIVCANDFYILIFATAEENRYRASHTTNMNDTSRAQLEKNLYPTEIYISVAIILSMTIFTVGIIRTIFFDTMCLRGSKNLHNSALDALISTKLRFFHTNPSGRILNRLSKDITIIDEALPVTLIDVIQIFSMVGGALFVTCTIAPIFVVPAIVIAGLCYWLHDLFHKSIESIGCLEAALKSPAFTQLNETLNGITTIRAFQAENLLINEFDKLLDLQFLSWYNFTACKFAFGIVMKTLTDVFIFIIVCVFVFFKTDFQSGDVGLVITQVFGMTSLMIYSSSVSTDVANFLKAVERLVEYSELPRESNNEPRDENKKQLYSAILSPKNWPENGEIEFRNVTSRYSLEDDPVLKFLNFRIEAHQKIGIVGRTGAGKSSLISALFRLSEIDGLIKIDGIDTGSISLTALRSHISIIPQNPVLFSGTLRQNLDPFNEYSDDDLWNVLEQVELKKRVSLESDGLDCKVQGKGANYSIGQKQLICLARAMLRKNVILVLDEATANVDPHTDLLIQETIREKFKSCTVLTVAHRLNTIIDSNKVIVMDNGYLVEFDHPYKLLQDENGYFTKLVKQVGDAMFQQFLQFTKLSYKNV